MAKCILECANLALRSKLLRALLQDYFRSSFGEQTIASIVGEMDDGTHALAVCIESEHLDKALHRMINTEWTIINTHFNQ